MFRIVFIFVLLLNTAAAQEPIRLIVRADDIGSSQSANEAIILTATRGIATSVEVMVPCPWFPEAVKLLNEHSGIDVGIHLTITSEWEHMKWRPLTDVPSLTDHNGYFYPMMFPNVNYPGLSIMEVQPSLSDIEKEFRAQIEMGLRLIPHASHISGHMGSTFFSSEVRALTAQLASEYQLGNDLAGFEVSGLRFVGPKSTGEEKIDSFLAAVELMEKGKTYLFVEHPALNTSEMQAIYHIGYEDVALDRQGVTDLFLSSRIKDALLKKGVELISYREFYQLQKQLSGCR